MSKLRFGLNPQNLRLTMPLTLHSVAQQNENRLQSRIIFWRFLPKKRVSSPKTTQATRHQQLKLGILVSVQPLHW
jgi:hypothetical protein